MAIGSKAIGSNVIRRASRKRSKLRLAIDGPSGSGKTFTALTLAEGLAPEGRILVIDTEYGSSEKYAAEDFEIGQPDRFAFDVVRLADYHPQNYIDMIALGEREGYAVIIIDSLSHAWEGKGGALELHDKATIKSGNSYTAWGDVTPLHRALIGAMLACKAHVIATMRSETEYSMEKDERGRTTIQKIGMKPIQRKGMEYEFDIVCDLDMKHNLKVSKTRLSILDGEVVKKPGREFGAKLAGWLNDVRPEDPEAAYPPSVSTEGLGAIKPARLDHLADLMAKAGMDDDAIRQAMIRRGAAHPEQLTEGQAEGLISKLEAHLSKYPWEGEDGATGNGEAGRDILVGDAEGPTPPLVPVPGPPLSSLGGGGPSQASVDEAVAAFELPDVQRPEKPAKEKPAKKPRKTA